MHNWRKAVSIHIHFFRFRLAGGSNCVFSSHAIYKKLLYLELKYLIVIGSALLHISDISQIYYWKPHRENKSGVLLGIRSARDWILILNQHVTTSCMQVMLRKIFIIDGNGMSDRCAFDGNQTFTLKQVDGWGDGSAFAKGLLGRNNKTFIGLPRT